MGLTIFFGNFDTNIFLHGIYIFIGFRTSKKENLDLEILISSDMFPLISLFIFRFIYFLLTKKEARSFFLYFNIISQTKDHQRVRRHLQFMYSLKTKTKYNNHIQVQHNQIQHNQNHNQIPIQTQSKPNQKSKIKTQKFQERGMLTFSDQVMYKVYQPKLT